MLTFGGMRFTRGPLTPEQRIVLENLSQRDADHAYGIERTVPVPPDRDLAEVSAAVHALVCRHEMLRTRFPAGGREQVVDGAGMLAIRMCDSAEEARTALVTDPVDIAAEWGVRVAVVCHGERPKSIVLRLSHLVVDTRAANQVVDDLCALLRGVELDQ